MVILTLLDDDDLECCGYEVRNCSKKGRGVFATKGKPSKFILPDRNDRRYSFVNKISDPKRIEADTECRI